jgi:hypothetical protein
VRLLRRVTTRNSGRFPSFALLVLAKIIIIIIIIMASSITDILFFIIVAFVAYWLGNSHSQHFQAAPGTRIDEVTGIEFLETQRFHVARSKLSLLGVGTRKKAILNVYSLGLFVSPAILEKELKKIDTSVKGDDAVCQTLLKSTAPKAVQLIFNIGIGPEKIAEAVSQLAGVDKKVREKFHDMLIDGMGDGKMKNGETMTFEWKGADAITATARGKLIGTVKDKKLARGVFELYVGPKSVSPSLKQNIGCS